ncbi:hypothetical protein [Cyclobacterium jeungdonense]|uniref:Uncharacterized protein n=1 Tax=Cyclobacterium jeungdonense TaxID=708087 RepID=A0ABT8CAT3_9BACT|nr:hypothetical protein [Cyclobacterium jeungdonense]MDN3688908.1 hypothetical protein [Cyclobacterium jeungdonense]
MKSKWLFLPDVILVLLLCLTCERHEMQHTGGRGNSQLSDVPVEQPWENSMTFQKDKKQKSWKKLIQAANDSPGSLMRQYIKD